jgi:hypothetical protein
MRMATANQANKARTRITTTIRNTQASTPTNRVARITMQSSMGMLTMMNRAFLPYSAHQLMP